eukprot:403330732
MLTALKKIQKDFYVKIYLQGIINADEQSRVQNRKDLVEIEFECTESVEFQQKFMDKMKPVGVNLKSLRLFLGNPQISRRRINQRTAQINNQKNQQNTQINNIENLEIENNYSLNIFEDLLVNSRHLRKFKIEQKRVSGYYEQNLTNNTQNALRNFTTWLPITSITNLSIVLSCAEHVELFMQFFQIESKVRVLKIQDEFYEQKEQKLVVDQDVLNSMDSEIQSSSQVKHFTYISNNIEKFQKQIFKNQTVPLESAELHIGCFGELLKHVANVPLKSFKLIYSSDHIGFNKRNRVEETDTVRFLDKLVRKRCLTINLEIFELRLNEKCSQTMKQIKYFSNLKSLILHKAQGDKETISLIIQEVFQIPSLLYFSLDYHLDKVQTIMLNQQLDAYNLNTISNALALPISNAQRDGPDVRNNYQNQEEMTSNSQANLTISQSKLRTIRLCHFRTANQIKEQVRDQSFVSITNHIVNQYITPIRHIVNLLTAHNKQITLIVPKNSYIKKALDEVYKNTQFRDSTRFRNFEVMFDEYKQTR